MQGATCRCIEPLLFGRHDRHSLVVIEGTLCGRYSRVDVEKFLTGHARLTADEAKYFAEQLRRTARSLEEDLTSRSEACTDDTGG